MVSFVEEIPGRQNNFPSALVGLIGAVSVSPPHLHPPHPILRPISLISFHTHSTSHAVITFSHCAYLLFHDNCDKKKCKKNTNLPTADGLGRCDWKEPGEETQAEDIFDWRDAGSFKM